MTVSVWQEMASPISAVSHDVVVVGAGLVGSYIAGLLTDSGRDVALVDKGFPAAGASGRNAGMVGSELPKLLSKVDLSFIEEERQPASP